VGILALQGAVAAHQRSLAGLGVSATLVRTPDDLDRVEALVLPGGESTTLWHLLKVNGLAEPLADRLAGGMPALGTCAGMILLASDVLDGRTDQGWFSAIDLTVRRNAFGRQVDSFECDLELPAVGAPDLHAVFIRAPQVERVGPGVEVLAAVDGGPVAAREGSVIVTAFHPELTPDTRVHRLFVALVAER
jgi:5'-phosphate synthase pdxT subunit